MVRAGLILIIMIAAQVASPADQAAAGAEDLVLRGRALVEEKCARCHATGMDDKSSHEKAPPFRDVVEIYPSEDLAEALAEGIVSGHPDMPVFTFTTTEIEGFLAYLNSLDEQRSARDAAPGP